MTKDMIMVLEHEGFVGEKKVRSPQGEMVPKPQAADAMVFRDFFTYDLRFPTARFLREVLEAFEVQMHHLTPNGILILSKFCCACLSYGAELHVGTFVNITSFSGSLRESAKTSLWLNIVAMPLCRRGSRRALS